MPPTPSLAELLGTAVDRGVISAEQRTALLGLAGEASSIPPRSPEIARGFNWVTIAYALGALLVVFACGWFMAERWSHLGPAGVLGVSFVYAAICAAMSWWLMRRGFREAAGIAAMLGVSLTPLAVWAAQSMVGWWPEGDWGRPFFASAQVESWRWIVVVLCTILAALLVLRRVPFVALAIPTVVALAALGMHLPRALIEYNTPLMERWEMLTTALMLCAVADTIARRQGDWRLRPEGGRGDFAFAFWLGGLIGLSMAILAFWPEIGAWRHLLMPAALLLAVVALVLGRRTHLVFAVVWTFLYLVYLASEVFRDSALFPLALAALGILLIAGTVWLQRRFPDWVKRAGGAGAAGRGGLPIAGWIPWLAVAASLTLMLLAIPEAREERVQQDFRARLAILRGHSGSLRPDQARIARARSGVIPPSGSANPPANPPSKPPANPPRKRP